MGWANGSLILVGQRIRLTPPPGYAPSGSVAAAPVSSPATRVSAGSGTEADPGSSSGGAGTRGSSLQGSPAPSSTPSRPASGAAPWEWPTDGERGRRGRAGAGRRLRHPYPGDARSGHHGLRRRQDHVRGRRAEGVRTPGDRAAFPGVAERLRPQRKNSRQGGRRGARRPADRDDGHGTRQCGHAALRDSPQRQAGRACSTCCRGATDEISTFSLFESTFAEVLDS